MTDPGGTEAERTGWVLLEAAALPAGDERLSPPERARAAALRVPARRRDFRLGRLAARRALAGWWGVPEPGAEVEIRAASDGAPEVVGAGAPAISLTHRAAVAVCLIGRAGLKLGADLEAIEPRSHELIDQFFTSAEQRLLWARGPAARDLVANLIWSAKESAAKALREGLRLDTRALVVEPLESPSRAGWRALRVTTPSGAFDGWWRQEGSLVLTAVGAPAIAPPERLPTG